MLEGSGAQPSPAGFAARAIGAFFGSLAQEDGVEQVEVEPLHLRHYRELLSGRTAPLAPRRKLRALQERSLSKHDRVWHRTPIGMVMDALFRDSTPPPH